MLFLVDGFFDDFVKNDNKLFISPLNFFLSIANCLYEQFAIFYSINYDLLLIIISIMVPIASPISL